MSGQRRLSRDGDRGLPSVPPRWASELNFGAICLVGLAALAIAATLIFSETQFMPAEFLISP
jgi:hypothetical protein